jgi:hypothetical protein
LTKCSARYRPRGDTITALAEGRARYHLALCEWRLNDRDAAQREAEESLKEYGDDEAAAAQKKQTEQLLADLKENKPLPPLAKVDERCGGHAGSSRARCPTHRHGHSHLRARHV